MNKNKYIFLNGLIDLAQSRLGSKIVYKTDDFFAPAKRIINPWPPVFKEGVFDKHGKWMDGWETRRKRTKGYDYLILSLGKPGIISKVKIDTSYFNGNQPEYASIEGCYSENSTPTDKTVWKSIINKSKLKPNHLHFFNTITKKIFTHIRLRIYPDGGIARLRLYGKIATEKLNFSKDEIVELSSILNGSLIIHTNNEHFGKAENILAPGRAFNMSDGWETRRRRSKGNDWLIFKFGIPGIIYKIIIDTSHFKGNYPDYFSLQGSYMDEKKSINKTAIIKQSLKWEYLIKNEKLGPNKEHFFDNFLLKNKILNLIKINIYPDGGISRINIFGKKKYK